MKYSDRTPTPQKRSHLTHPKQRSHSQHYQNSDRIPTSQNSDRTSTTSPNAIASHHIPKRDRIFPKLLKEQSRPQ
ncbi:MAG: hypothetical protein ACK5OU_12260 [Dolichospermum sp.]